MSFLRGLFVGVSLLLAGSTLLAAEATVSVEAVQSPAWLERGEQQWPLQAGQSIRNRDRIVTGGDARVLLRLSDGSAVKLGENASLRVDALGVRDGGVFSAALDVARGAFRFTTGLFARFQDRRAVNVRIATVTAGIRGTDLWGSANDERDLVCLIEGRITVMHAEAEPVQMGEPLSFYVAEKNRPPQPVAPVDPAQLTTWAAETELRQGGATLRRGGRWSVLAAEERSEAAALARYDQLRAAGYPVRIKPVAEAGGGYRYALRVPGLADRAGAEALAVRLRLESGLEGTRVLSPRGGR